MLRFELAYELLADCQNAYAATPGSGARIADQVRMVRRLIRAQAESFNRGQARDPSEALGDGRTGTIADQVLGARAPHSWPGRAGAILHGIHLSRARSLPGTACCPDGPSYYQLDPETYLTSLDVGPPQARSFGQMTCLVAYLDAPTVMSLVWIGREADLEDGLQSILRRTSGMTDWSAIDASYQHYLAELCRTRSGT